MALFLSRTDGAEEERRGWVGGAFALGRSRYSISLKRLVSPQCVWRTSHHVDRSNSKLNIPHSTHQKWAYRTELVYVFLNVVITYPTEYRTQLYLFCLLSTKHCLQNSFTSFVYCLQSTSLFLLSSVYRTQLYFFCIQFTDHSFMSCVYCLRQKRVIFSSVLKKTELCFLHFMALFPLSKTSLFQ